MSIIMLLYTIKHCSKNLKEDAIFPSFESFPIRCLINLDIKLCISVNGSKFYNTIIATGHTCKVENRHIYSSIMSLYDLPKWYFRICINCCLFWWSIEVSILEILPYHLLIGAVPEWEPLFRDSALTFIFKLLRNNFLFAFIII